MPPVLGCTPEVEVVDEERPWAGVSGKRVDANRASSPGAQPPPRSVLAGREVE